MILKKVEYPRMNEADWEEVPQEDLWQDGEIKYPEIKDIIYHQVIKQGEWKLIRRINNGSN